MPGALFDMRLRAMRRDRAFRRGPALFLHERAFDDCLDRLQLVHRSFRSALLVGCPDPAWARRLERQVETVRIVEPGPLFAAAAGVEPVTEDDWDAPKANFDVCVAVGTLDTVNDLPKALRIIRTALRADSLFVGALTGGDTLPQLRSAMRAADAGSPAAAPHVHPRIEPSAVAPLLSAAGFTMPVVEIDRIGVRYRSLHSLVDDLRAMGATNILNSRAKNPIRRRDYAAASAHFDQAGDGERTTELVEIIHFSAWTPQG
jgi:NADH dehydrogenase [ubiquinone] 1 alpha subcomplex assembly factor 5